MLWFWTPAALAASVYVNGVNVDGLRNQTFENATVTIDANGNVQINAPGYRIEVQAPPTPSTVSASGTTTASAGSVTSASSAKATSASGVAPGQWWLVTEDNGSKGHVIQVFVNERLVHTVKSGEAQSIVDIGAYLRPGSNAVRLSSNSQSAGGGSLYVYIGHGGNQSGTVVLDRPDIQYGLSSSRSGPYGREYTLQVQ